MGSPHAPSGSRPATATALRSRGTSRIHAHARTATVGARLVSDAFLSSDLEAYAPALRAELGPHASASWQAKFALDRFPRLVYSFARFPPVWCFVDALLRGELKTPSEARGVARVPLQVVKALGTR